LQYKLETSNTRDIQKRTKGTGSLRKQKGKPTEK